MEEEVIHTHDWNSYDRCRICSTHKVDVLEGIIVKAIVFNEEHVGSSVLNDILTAEV
jgi:hypothetical protein